MVSSSEHHSPPPPREPPARNPKRGEIEARTASAVGQASGRRDFGVDDEEPIRALAALVGADVPRPVPDVTGWADPAPNQPHGLPYRSATRPAGRAMRRAHMRCGDDGIRTRTTNTRLWSPRSWTRADDVGAPGRLPCPFRTSPPPVLRSCSPSKGRGGSTLTLPDRGIGVAIECPEMSATVQQATRLHHGKTAKSSQIASAARDSRPNRTQEVSGSSPLGSTLRTTWK